jgi:alpha-tubulin suppressor-like RCC1 family protein
MGIFNINNIMPGYKYSVVDSSGNYTQTYADFDDVFVPRDLFLNSGLYVWGDNQEGALGLGDTVDRSTPTQFDSGSNWRYITGSFASSYAIKTDGSLWSCGTNTNGQLGVGDNLSRSSPVQVGSLKNWKEIGAADSFAFGIKTDGTIWAWGENDNGSFESFYLGIGDNINQSITSPTQIGILNNWKQIRARRDGGCALKTDGTLWTWGTNQLGQNGYGTTINNSSAPLQVGSLTDWKYISPSRGEFTFAIKTNGTLWSWGRNNNGQLGLGDIINRSSPVQVGSLTDWKMVACGVNHTIAIKTDGTLWGWGVNSLGHLGLGDTTNRSSPVQVGSLTNWKKVLVGIAHNIALKTDSTIWSWGRGSLSALGLGDTIDRSSPVQIGSINSWSDIGTGANSSYAILSPDLPV